MKDLQTVLDALENSVDLVEGEHTEAVEQYGHRSHRKPKIDGLAALVASHKEAIALIKQMMQAEPVAYEFRTCPERVTESNEWTPCSKKQHEMYIRTPMFENWVYETRALFAAPQAVPAHLEEQPDGSVVDTRSEPQAVPEYVQRVVLPFESSLPYERNTA